MMKAWSSAPATVANLGPGFDVLGMALSEPRDHVEAIVEPGERRVIIESIEGVDAHLVDGDPSHNSAAVAVMTVLEKLGVNATVKLRIRKGVPVAAGLGSSGASAAAAVHATLSALGASMDLDEAVWCAAQGEKAVAGAAHADNVAPSYLGGVCAIVSQNPLRVIRVDAPQGLHVVIVRPILQLGIKDKTRMARSLLPKSIPFEKLVEQTSSLTALLLGIMTSNPELMGAGMSRDVIIEPARSTMIPGFNQAKKAALEAGAYGCTISGAGPSIVALTSREAAPEVARAIEEALRENGVSRTQVVLTTPSNRGARRED